MHSAAVSPPHQRSKGDTVKLKIIGTCVATCVATCIALVAGPAWGQAKFPDKTMRIVVPFAAGGGVDTAARLLAQQLSEQLGVSVIVDNRPGANGTIGGKYVQSAPADGYTLLFSAATHVLARQVMATPPYDPLTDFAPVAHVGEAPLLMVIAPKREQTKLSEVIAAAKQQPEKWTAAIPAAGAPSHLATLLLAKQSGVKFTFVPYKGTQPAATDVAGGHVDLLLDSMISLLPLAKGGKVKPIAMTSGKRSPLAPDIPTAQESGFPGFTYVTWYGVWAPKDTPPDRLRFLNGAINNAVGRAAKAGGWAAMGIDPVNEDIEQFRRYSETYVAQSADLLKSVGFKPE
jgi:tripartite-type tricarboxylate transporter receptor subunit TctC